MEESKEKLLNAIRHYQDSLERHIKTGNGEKLLHAIEKLSRLPIKMCHLEETGIGRTVNGLKKVEGKVGENARNLVDRWKSMVRVEHEAEQQVEKVEKPSEPIEEHVENNIMDEDPDPDSLQICDAEQCDNDNKPRYVGTDYSSHKEPSNSNHSSDRHRTNHKRSRSRDRQYKKPKSSHSKHDSDDSESDTNNKSKKPKPSTDSHKKSSRRHSSDSESPSDSVSDDSESERDSSSSRKHSRRNSSESSDRSSSGSEDDSSSDGDSKKNKYKKHHSDRESKKINSSDCNESNSDSESRGKYRKTKEKSSDTKESKKHSKSDSDKEKHSKSRASHSESRHSNSKERTRDSKDMHTKSKETKNERESGSRKDSSSSKSKKVHEDNESKHKKDLKESDKSKSKSGSDRDSKKSSKNNTESNGDSKRNSKSHKERESNSKNDKKRERASSTDRETKKHKGSGSDSRESKSKSHRSSSSSKSNDKDSENKKEKDKHKRDSSTSNSKSTPDKDKDKSKTHSAASSSKPKMSPKKLPIINGIDSESGASFADVLGMLEAPVFGKNKKKSSTILSLERSLEKGSSNDRLEKASTSKSSASASAGGSSTSKEPAEVPKLLKDPPSELEPLDINMTSLLPSITPNYRPLSLPLDYQPKKLWTDDEALSRVINAKHQRTKVYSGNKITYTKVPTLFDLCSRVLQDNIDALEYTGGVPYSILKPIIEKANPDQLFQLEFHNPYLIEDSDELWLLHCQREFRTKKREEMESWRDMYMRCLDEREAKLKALTANIKQSQDVKVPVRTTKLAYLDSVVKPPRNIARRQAKNGTAVEIKRSPQTPTERLNQLAKSGEASKVSVPNPGRTAVEKGSSSQSHHSSHFKPKKAPLMAKTLSLLKNRFGRR